MKKAVENENTARLVHGIAPVFNGRSRVLILGSFPSVASRASGFYYGNPQNRFWSVIAGITGRELPQTRGEKTELLLSCRIALWDTVAECSVRGSADSSICGVVPCDIMRIFTAANIEAVFANGKKAGELYAKYLQPLTGMQATLLPSTSPAAAAYSQSSLCAAWSVILPYIK